MNLRQQNAHMRAAQVYADLSYCERKKVGCVVVKGNKVISIGYNGTPAGEDNCCEEDGKTKANVIHAEDNALRKLSHFDATNSSLFVTTAPCLECAKKIKQYAIKEVYYQEVYTSTLGIKYLTDNGINVERLEV